MTSLPGDSLVNHTQLPGSDLAKKMSATCGPRCLERYERLPRVGLLARMFAGYLVGMEGWYSTRCKLTWKLVGTKSGRLYFQLAVSTLPTDGIGFGLLPTPTAMVDEAPIEKVDARNQKQIERGNSPFILGLGQQAMRGLLPTPRTTDQRMHWKTENWKGDDLGSWMNEMCGTRSHLNPLFVAEMMGFPLDYLTLPFQSGETNQSKR